MRIEYHRYQLHPRGNSALNALTGRMVYEGALIRVDGVGVGCMHPWPELGDATLDDELAALSRSQPLLLGRCALDCARIDGVARREGRSLFLGLDIPPSHWTAAPGDDPSEVVARGFSVAKLKMGKGADRADLDHWLAEPGIERLRLDFNASLERAEFESFWSGLDVETQPRIEFVEDPYPFEPQSWRETEARCGVRLAADPEEADLPELEPWQGVVVLKPARIRFDSIDKLLKDRHLNVVFTSSLDHAIGQLWAAFAAARANLNRSRRPECGLCSHLRFEADEGFPQLQTLGNVLQPPKGTGLGLDPFLDSLSWTPLI